MIIVQELLSFITYRASDDICPICLRDVISSTTLRRPSQNVKTMPCCGKQIHFECLDKWYDEKLECPNCREKTEIFCAFDVLTKTIKPED